MLRDRVWRASGIRTVVLCESRPVLGLNGSLAITDLFRQTWYLVRPDTLRTNGMVGVAVNQEMLEESHVL
jgi:hypothetical protein